MAFATSSQIGVDLNNASATQLFTLNQEVIGSDDSVWTYVYATASITTGAFVYIAPQGTANLMNAAYIAAATAGGNIGCAQFTISAASYGFVAKRGSQLYVLVTGSLAPPAQVGFGSLGVIGTSLLMAAGATAAGIFVWNSANSATNSVVLGGMLTYPRTALVTGVPAT